MDAPALAESLEKLPALSDPAVALGREAVSSPITAFASLAAVRQSGSSLIAACMAARRSMTSFDCCHTSLSRMCIIPRRLLPERPPWYTRWLGGGRGRGSLLVSVAALSDSLSPSRSASGAELGCAPPSLADGGAKGSANCSAYCSAAYCSAYPFAYCSVYSRGVSTISACAAITRAVAAAAAASATSGAASRGCSAAWFSKAFAAAASAAAMSSSTT
mmetsp:Transcript_14079/g.58798  ORF Transcript_14079/g.58798 Transcript_14079/m.58798 type:complete len:218 (-) Transcript_14079:1346-1999(-)